MIAPQELRLGNYVKSSSAFKILSINQLYVSLSNGTISNIADLLPIELTEDWLLMFGFEKRDDDKYYHHKYNRTWVKIESCIVKWYGNAIGGLVMIDYVHELQNTFAVFTKEELTIKKEQP